MAETRLGLLSDLYINTGTYGSPTWEAIDLISDLSVNLTFEEGDSSARRSVIKTAEPTMITLEIPGKIRTDRVDTGYIALEDATLNKTVLDVLVLNGHNDVEHSAGYRFDVKNFEWSEDQALGNVLFKSFKLKPCASSNIPKIAVVTGGTVVFRDFGSFTGS